MSTLGDRAEARAQARDDTFKRAGSEAANDARRRREAQVDDKRREEREARLAKIRKDLATHLSSRPVAGDGDDDDGDGDAVATSAQAPPQTGAPTSAAAAAAAVAAPLATLQGRVNDAEDARLRQGLDRALVRRFQKIDVVEPSVEQTVEIMKGLKSRFEDHHNVKYALGALQARVETEQAEVGADPQLFVTVGDDAKVIVWDTRTFQPLEILTGHAGRITWPAFSADSRTAGRM